MHQELLDFARLLPLSRDPARLAAPDEFNRLAVELFSLQFRFNPGYRKICEARGIKPASVRHWTQIPFVPTAAFKELELTSIPAAEWTAVFHSSGTTEQRPSRHFHCRDSLQVYEQSLWSWFEHQVPERGVQSAECGMICLTPAPAQAPHSSLVHMFDTIRKRIGGARVPTSRDVFFGEVDADGVWTLDFDAVVNAICSTLDPRPSTFLLGTAFSFVHLLDHLAERDLRLRLPPGSRVMETGGYKNRSRSMPKAELHALITDRLAVPAEDIICEYGMSELSSQAYCLGAPAPRRRNNPIAGEAPAVPGHVASTFQFPPWARVQIISPETGKEVAEGEAGIVRIFDLANVFSVAAVRTEDLGVRWGNGFELIGRAVQAEPRGCSLMSA